MPDGPTFNQTTTGGSPQVNQGVTINEPSNVTNNGAASMDDLLALLQSAKQVAVDSGTEWAPETPQAVRDQFPTVGAMFDEATTKVQDDIATGSYTIEPDVATGFASPADTGAPALGTPEGDFLEEKESWFNNFKLLPPKVIQGGLVVGEAVLSCYVSKSPVVAGALAAIAFIKGD